MADYCTLWPDKLLGVYYGDLCYDHDAAYRTFNFKLKMKSDFILAWGIFRRSRRAARRWQQVLIAGSAGVVLIGVLTGGTIKWFMNLAEDRLFANVR